MPEPIARVSCHRYGAELERRARLVPAEEREDYLHEAGWTRERGAWTHPNRRGMAFTTAAAVREQLARAADLGAAPV